jgi:phage shock protein PspC (stress-responsive transcriptional regulator)
MGWLGFAAFLAFVAAVLRQGLRAIHLARSPAERWMALGVLAGVASYLVHGFFNNYTGIDKVVIPLWFLISIIAFMGSRPPSPRDASSI